MEAMALEKMLSMAETTMQEQQELEEPKSEEPTLEDMEDEQMALRKQNAAQLAAQLREAGQHEKADEIESLLAQAAQAANEETPVAQLAVEEPVELSVEEEAKEIMTERVEKVKLDDKQRMPPEGIRRWKI